MSDAERIERAERFLKNTELIHAVMGLSGELGEFIEVLEEGKDQAIKIEAGDYLHYLNRIIDLLNVGNNISQCPNVTNRYTTSDLTKRTCQLVDIIKKNVAYGKKSNPTLLIHSVDMCYEIFTNLIEIQGLTIEDVEAGNLDKLNARYGDSYSNEKAIKQLDNKGKV